MSLKSQFLAISIFILATAGIAVMLSMYLNPAPDSVETIFNTRVPTATPLPQLSKLLAQVDTGTVTPVPTAAANCTYPADYWKGRPESWPYQMVMGGTVYSNQDARSTFNAKTDDVVVLITRQLFTTFLNLLGGSDPRAIQTTVLEANNWLSNHLPGSILSENERLVGLNMLRDLEAYNHGLSGPGLCPDSPHLPTSTLPKPLAQAVEETQATTGIIPNTGPNRGQGQDIPEIPGPPPPAASHTPNPLPTSPSASATPPPSATSTRTATPIGDLPGTSLPTASATSSATPGAGSTASPTLSTPTSTATPLPPTPTKTPSATPTPTSPPQPSPLPTFQPTSPPPSPTPQPPTASPTPPPPEPTRPHPTHRPRPTNNSDPTPTATQAPPPTPTSTSPPPTEPPPTATEAPPTATSSPPATPTDTPEPSVTEDSSPTPSELPPR